MLLEPVIARFADVLANKALDKILGPSGAMTNFTSPRVGEILTPEMLEEALATHLGWADGWSSGVHFYKMPEPAPVDAVTLPLDLSTMARRFKSIDAPAGRTREHTLTEEDVLNGAGPYLLIGDPGAGKTTTLKRLVRRMLAPPRDHRDVWDVPIVVLLRQHTGCSSIADVILNVLALSMPVERLLEQYKVHVRASPSGGLADSASAVDWDYAAVIKHQLVASLLDSLGAVLMLDGLDEVPDSSRKSLERSIELVTSHMRHVKVIVSCRAGDFPFLNGYSLLEICELSDTQVSDIATRWLGKPARREFLKAIARGNAVELINRPLFLCQMLAIYKYSGRIPDQPSTLCREMVRLVLQEWDHQRRFIRGSRYKDFDTESKLEFLTALAFIVTFGLQAQRFAHSHLVSIYDFLCSRFDLPVGEGQAVAGEIETHTGIIVSLMGGFEFAHLSLQEFLAAEHIVRLPDSSVFKELFERNAEVLAVAVARSSDPSRFLAILTNELDDETYVAMQAKFITRLLQERPRLAGSDHLAVAGLNLLAKFEPTRMRIPDKPTLPELFQYGPMSSAFATFTSSRYDIHEPADPLGGTVTYVRRPGCETFCGLKLPGQVSMSSRLYEIVTTSGGASANSRTTSDVSADGVFGVEEVQKVMKLADGRSAGLSRW